MNRLLALGVVLGVAASACPSEPTVEELLSAMRKAYRETKTANFQTKSEIREAGQELTVTLDGQFMAPDKMKVSFTGVPSGEVVLYCDGKRVSIVIDGKVVRSLDYSLDNLGRSLFANLETLSFFDWKRQLSTEAGGNMQKSTLKVAKEEWNGKSWLVLEEHAPEQKVDVRYFVDPATHFIWRTVATMVGDKQPFMDARIVKLELNPAIDEKIFVPPK